MKKARYYEKVLDKLKCTLCPRECVLSSGQKGYCGAKENRKGDLYSTIYAQVTSIAVDPIEKKPLYHFYPGSDILSVGTVGCNLSCKFCQNWHIVQERATTRHISSEDLVQLALEHNTIGIAYTYSEPLIWYEYIIDTARVAREAGLKNVLVTNGIIQKNPLKELLKYIDGLNLDIKGFNPKFYHQICGGDYLETVKETARLTADYCHLEITTLLIPGLNDTSTEIEELAVWLANINPDIPLHFSRYFPQYKLNLPPTPVDLMVKLKEVAEKYLHYVYLGNLNSADTHTYCYHCRQLIIKRDYEIKIRLNNGHCPQCGIKINIVE